MSFKVNQTVKLISNGELVDIHLIKPDTFIVFCKNYTSTGIPEEIEVPHDAVEEWDLPAVQSYKDY